jgi:hypothetical protein
VPGCHCNYPGNLSRELTLHTVSRNWKLYASSESHESSGGRDAFTASCAVGHSTYCPFCACAKYCQRRVCGHRKITSQGVRLSYKQFVGGALAPSVYCDDVQLARMDNGRYFMATIPAGKHTFRSNEVQSGMDLNLRSGQEYFLRVEIATGFMKGHGRLVLMPREQASYELRTAKLKPLDLAKVADKTRVSVAEVHLIDTPPPAVEAVTPAPAARLVTVSATESTVKGVSIQGSDGTVGTGSATGDQTSLGEAARRNKRPQPTR